MAAQRPGSVKVSVQPEKDWLEAMAMLVFLFAFGEYLEEEFGAAAVEFHVAEFVDDEQVNAAVAVDGLGELFLVGGFDQFVHEFGGEGVANSEAHSDIAHLSSASIRYHDSAAVR